MKIKIYLFGIACAILLHAESSCLEGRCSGTTTKIHGTLQQVELLRDDDVAGEKEKPKELELETEKAEEKEAEPDIRTPMRSFVTWNCQAAANAPELEAASLSSIEAALSGQAGGGDFAEALSLSSGGRIGGTGKAGALGDGIDSAFNLAEIDQKPRAIFPNCAGLPMKCAVKTRRRCQYPFCRGSDRQGYQPAH